LLSSHGPLRVRVGIAAGSVVGETRIGGATVTKFVSGESSGLAAHHLSRHGRVAFIDIDYHHGNGSQEIFYKRNDVYFVSVHGHPRVSYPYFVGVQRRTRGQRL